jgi:hypothetical protein
VTAQIGREALIPNPRLKAFEPFIGAWTTTGRHPMVPGKTLHGRATIDWHEGGAFVIVRSETDEPEIPSGVAIFGTDDDGDSLSMIYFDERRVSRRYEARIRPDVLEWWRSAPDLSQRNTITIAGDKQSMRGVGEMSRDGGPWGPDLGLDYTRAHAL